MDKCDEFEGASEPPTRGASAPCGPVGPDTDRDRRGRFAPGNGAALVAGEHSAEFWRTHEAIRHNISREILADAGHVSGDAPRALVIAAESIAQALLIRDSAYARMADAGGPLTASGRVRRAVVVWSAAVDRLERHLRLVGLGRVPRPAPTLAQYLASRVDDTLPDHARPASNGAAALATEE